MLIMPKNCNPSYRACPQQCSRQEPDSDCGKRQWDPGKFQNLIFTNETSTDAVLETDT